MFPLFAISGTNPLTTLNKITTKEKNISVNEIDESENSLEESSESIEKVSFIAKPIKKKSIKSTKRLS